MHAPKNGLNSALDHMVDHRSLSTLDHMVDHRSLSTETLPHQNVSTLYIFIHAWNTVLHINPQILNCIAEWLRMTGIVEKQSKFKCTHACISAHAHTSNMQCINTLKQYTLFTAAHIWVVTQKASSSKLHCSWLRSCYIHWLISRVLLYCNTTAGHTPSTLIILRLSCGFGMGLLKAVCSHLHFSIVGVGAFCVFPDWRQLLIFYRNKYT